MNSVVLTGNLTKDVESKQTNNGKAVAQCTLAWNRGEETGFFDCIAFEKPAELLRDYCHKGSKILIRGELKQDRWKDKEGAARSAVRLVIKEIEFLSNKEQKGAPEGQQEPEEENPEESGDLPF